MAKSYCVVYRTGGRENFQWQRSVADTKEATQVRLAEVQRMGYHCFMVDHYLSMRIGLPETFSANDPIPGNEV